MKCSGFTLLELLVAAAITLVLAGLLLAVTTGTLDQWKRTRASHSANVDAMIVFDLIERDLESAVFRETGGDWLAVDVVDDPAALVDHGWRIDAPRIKPGGATRLLSGTGDSGGLEEVRFGLSGAWLRFVTTNVETSGSLPVAVSYQIVRRAPSGLGSASSASVRYTLHRSAATPENSLAAGMSVTAPAYRSSSSVPGPARSAPTIANPTISDALAGNVIDFGVWLYVRGADGNLRRVFPGSDADTAHVGRTGAGGADDVRFPEIADVMVRILSEEGALLIADIESGAVSRPARFATDAEWWWSVAEANSSVHVRRFWVGRRF